VAGEVATAVAAEVADHRVLPWARLGALGVPLGAPQGAAQAEAVALLQQLLEAGLLFLPTEEVEQGDDDEADERVQEVDLDDEGCDA
jgi:hypothetical protein